jgi:uncharacterized protein (TIGR00251 family)
MGKKQNRSDRGKSDSQSCAQMAVSVHPRSSRDCIEAIRDGVLHLRLRAAPVEGKANEALIEILSKLLALRKSSISIVRGERSREKMIRIENITEQALIERISSIVAESTAKE